MKSIYSCEIKKLKNFYLKKGYMSKEYYNMKEDYETFEFGGEAYLYSFNKTPKMDYYTFNKNIKMRFDQIYVNKTIIPNIVKEIVTGKLFYLHDNDNKTYEVDETNNFKAFVANKNSLKKITEFSDKEILEQLKSYLENKGFITKLINEIRCTEEIFYSNDKTKTKGK